MEPVPRIQISIDEAEEFDGGDATTEEADGLDGGDAEGPSATVDAGSASTVSIEVPEGTDHVTVWRTCSGRRMKVRGAVSRAFSGALGVLDMEAGRGVPSSYELECWSGGSVVGTVSIGQATLPSVGDRWETIIQQPLNPRLNVVLEELWAMVPEISRVAPGGLVEVEDSSYPTSVGFGPRSGLSEIELAFAAVSREMAAKVWATLGDESAPQVPVWLVRSNHPLLPPVFFCDARTLREVGLDLHLGGERSRFFMSTREVKPPAPALVAASLTYDDLAAVFPTYTEMSAALPTYSQMASAWEYAGAAG